MEGKEKERDRLVKERRGRDGWMDGWMDGR